MVFFVCFSLLNIVITLIDFGMLKEFCIPEINSSLS